MKNYTPKVGDLVCYNAAGMRKHSLGLVLEKRYEDVELIQQVPYIFIEWIKKPSRPPRTEFRYSWKDARDERWTPDGCTAAWYRDYGCFEVIEKK
ncbi:hypothetical protein CMI47_04975 [Candidatus Pacearchaeota archaeon]|nr:hypothetical protein [Candidatus Pacearchaeota archaeon]|tara:strand:- start:1541 stop:1825 length:285 start_codon:yes stop_codon:yes gene_type:complete